MNTPHDREDYAPHRWLLPQGLPREDFRQWMSSAAQAVKWHQRLRIKGPIAGRLYVCYRHDKPGKTATAITPEGAYNAWQSYWGTEA